MKKIIIITLLFTGTLSFSCKETSTKHAGIRRIINETKYNVKIEIFETIDDKLTYELNKFDTLELAGYCWIGMDNWCLLGWSDSYPFGNIYFDQDRVLKYSYLYGDDTKEKFINGNPRFFEHGYIESQENRIDIYTYRITQEDYDKAEPVGG